jgi:thiol:disulfide interchange protein DsbD
MHVPLGAAGAVRTQFEPARYVEAVKASGGEAVKAVTAAGVPGDGGFDPRAVVVVDADGSSADAPIWQAMLWGFVGGFILNFMPCVLPVIGLKILSFVQQSGQSRWRIFLLNLYYTLGLLAVFMVLAALAALPQHGLGWGQLFSFVGFNVTLASVVFAMGLSFLGVWEIPVPGFVGGSKANKLASQEGFTGAFSKGVVTTLLATPCSGPYLGSALLWGASQRPAMVFALFACIGLGMASPYLVIGAFPGLIRFLPKPGAWMDTFKQMMGFMLLATVIYILTFIPWSLVVPTVSLLGAIGTACWLIGRTPLTAELSEKLQTWGMAAAGLTVATLMLFPGLDRLTGGRVPVGSLSELMAGRYERDIERVMAERLAKACKDETKTGVVQHKEHAPGELPWQPYSRAALVEATAAHKTVLVDFTADWCQTCKALEQFVLNTPETLRVIEANQVVTLQADWTHGSEEVTSMLETLGSKAIPVVAIFPADRPNQPIVLRNAYTRPTLLKALTEAGPSQAANTRKVTSLGQ